MWSLSALNIITYYYIRILIYSLFIEGFDLDIRLRCNKVLLILRRVSFAEIFKLFRVIATKI